MAVKKWGVKEERFLKSNVKKMTSAQLAKKLGISTRIVEAKLRKMGLSGQEVKKGKKMKGNVKKVEEPDKDNLFVIRSNIRCRSCMIVDGYTQEDNVCRYCGARLFRVDVL